MSSTLWRDNRGRFIAIALVIAGVFLFDVFAPFDVSIAVLYTLAISIAIGTFSESGIIAVAAIASLLTCTGFFVVHDGDLETAAAGRCLVALIAIAGTTAIAVWTQRAAKHDRVERQQLAANLDRIQVELRHLGRVTLMGELSSAIVHEIRQPLSAIAIEAEAGRRWQARGISAVAEADACFERIIVESRRADAIIARLRAMARQESGTSSVFSFNDIVNDVVPLIRRELVAHSVKLDLSLPPSSHSICGDRVQFQQVLLNLALNAIQAMAPDENARHVLKLHAGYTTPDTSLATLEVRDTGPGIPAELSERLFQPFFTTKPQGMGMGLSICRSIVEAHGGCIEIVPNEGGGAAFRIAVPTAAPLTEAVHDVPAQGHQGWRPPLPA
ncbi:Adaptive-response sensory-kinase SasA [Starkeya nomas]|uniref:histidine kinase n=1 Tax=Starkeya nomas TaxID=2666134 RepID=A0A5S9NJI6_9HYPH|nr:ATP-binding protein [Starkeya nomas]CAA0090294.1 Adaptive-response sensory-kinase SasA [Starkeya nomas]